MYIETLILHANNFNIHLYTNIIIQLLKVKQPSPHPNSSIPPSPVVIPFLPPVSIDDVARAIRSFPNGSAGGPDGLRSHHLKDMTNSSNAVDPYLELLLPHLLFHPCA